MFLIERVLSTVTMAKTEINWDSGKRYRNASHA